MDRTATPKERTATMERQFERSRLSEEILASAYERLAPIARRPIRLTAEYHEQHTVARQQRQPRRASA